MTNDEIDMIRNLGRKIEEDCLSENIQMGCAAIDALAEFYEGPYSELVPKTLTNLVDACEISDTIREHLYKTIKLLKQTDKIRRLGSKA